MVKKTLVTSLLLAGSVNSTDPFYFKSGDCSSLRLTGKCVETKTQYPNNVKCTIGVRKPTSFETQRFAIEQHHSCGWDYLQINGRKYCGHKDFEGTTSSDIVFSTDYSVTDGGFRLCEAAPQPAPQPPSDPECWEQFETECGGSCPSGNGNGKGKWVAYAYFDVGCCTSADLAQGPRSSCGGYETGRYREYCHFRCNEVLALYPGVNTRRLEDTDSLEAPRLGERLLKLAA